MGLFRTIYLYLICITLCCSCTVRIIHSNPNDVIQFSNNGIPPVASVASDQFVYAPVPHSSSANVFTKDTSGNLYVGGDANDFSSNSHWVVREFSNGVWSTIDDYQYGTGLLPAQFAVVTGLATDISGNVYAVGYANDGTKNHWIVRKYSNGVWTILDDYLYSGAVSTAATSIAVDPSSGNIYVAGEALMSSGIWHWVVREYSGGSWSPSDDFVFEVFGGVAQAITLDSSGNVYVAGWGIDSTTLARHWLVREYSSGAWNPADDYLSSGSLNEAFAITADSSGNVYVAGYAEDSSSVTHWVVREGSGTSWGPLDDFTYTSSAEATSITFDSATSTLYVGGNGIDGGSVKHWLVREYSTGSWSPLDDYQYASGQNATANGLGLDLSGNLYAVGSGNNAAGVSHWLTREYSGGSWSTNDDYQKTVGLSFDNALTTDASGNVYAAGYGNDSAGSSHWIVREYSDGSWNTIDDYQDVTGQSATAVAVVVDSSGNIFVAGSASDGTANHWIVRKYSDGSWSTIGDYQYASGKASAANALAIDPSGNIYVAGSGTDGSSIVHWVVREYLGGSWSTIDDYQYAAGETATANALAIDLLGNVYAAGSGTDSSSSVHWIVREFSGGSWSPIDDYQYLAGKLPRPTLLQRTHLETSTPPDMDMTTPLILLTGSFVSIRAEAGAFWITANIPQEEPPQPQHSPSTLLGMSTRQDMDTMPF